MDFHSRSKPSKGRVVYGFHRQLLTKVKRQGHYPDDGGQTFKVTHFIPLCHPYSSKGVAKTFTREVTKAPMGSSLHHF